MVKARKNNRNRRAVAVKQKAPRDIHRKFFKPNFEKKISEEMYPASESKND